ncbi:MAG: glycosyltransferase [Vicinamibacterales bacterium]
MTRASLRVVHVIQQVSGGGAARIAVAQAAGGRALGDDHTIASLLPPDARGERIAAAANVPVITGAASALEACRTSDIVQVHFWNSPELYAFLDALTHPLRIALLCQVAGDTAPHVLTADLVSWADCVVAGCPYTASLPVLKHPVNQGATPPAMIWSTIGFERLAAVERQPNERFTIGYIGTVDFGKMHPAFVELHASPALASARMLVCGSGDGFRQLERDAARLGVRERFVFAGYTEDIGRVLAQCDVFGYPLRPGASSGAELVLQEAAYCGVPAVVLSHGGAATTVQHGVTGLIAGSEADYAAALAELATDASLRHRLGAGAAAFARQMFDTGRAAAAYRTLYDAMMQSSPRPRSLGYSSRSGAARFVASLGVHGAAFQRSLDDAGISTDCACDAGIADAPSQVVDAASGGVLHYRRLYPGDPHLRLWSGLVLRTLGRRALAAAEFNAATHDPRTARRARAYLDELLVTPMPAAS